MNEYIPKECLVNPILHHLNNVFGDYEITKHTTVNSRESVANTSHKVDCTG